MMDADDIPARRWSHSTAPRRILAIRFQALGDTMITLPYLLGVRRRYPDAELHLLTREEVAAVPKAMTQFDRVVAIGGKRSRVRTWLSALAATPGLLGRRYDVVLDLQNNRVSNFVRRAIRPRPGPRSTASRRARPASARDEPSRRRSVSTPAWTRRSSCAMAALMSTPCCSGTAGKRASISSC
jgi:ADP-heptose:LPS heptosyltransferase